MKITLKKSVNVLGLFALVRLFISCDEVDPIIPLSINYDAETYGPAPEFSNATPDLIIQRVLVEDFTGHTCGNCPEAAIIAEDIYDNNPEKISVIAVHAGSYAEVHDDHYTVDWTCEAGNVLWGQIAGPFNPIGRINRAPDVSVGTFHTTWSDQVDPMLDDNPYAVVQMEVNYHADAGDLNIHVFSEFINSYDGEVKMSVLIVESHLIGDQKDYSQDPELVEDYEFNHLLRDAVNGAVGVTIANSPSAGETVQNDYTYEFNPEWVPENCDVVAVVTDASSGQVINVQHAHVVD